MVKVLVARRVGTCRFAARASPAHLAGARCVLILDLVPRDLWPFHAPGGGGGGRFSVEAGGQVEIDDGEALRASALAGAGITYAPRDLVAADLAGGRLVEVLGGWRARTLPTPTLHPSRRLVPHLVPRRVSAVTEAVAEGLKGWGAVRRPGRGRGRARARPGPRRGAQPPRWPPRRPGRGAPPGPGPRTACPRRRRPRRGR